MKKLILFLLALQFFVSVEAQSPNFFKFQSIVRDFSGFLITDKLVHIQINILKSSATGTVVYSEKHDVSTNKFGIVNLNIGAGEVTLGTFTSINWSDDQYFISISINGSMIGTSQLMNVPYALYADKAANGFSGNYNDLKNKPTLFDGTWGSVTNVPQFATVSSSGSYNDLVNKPAFDGSYGTLSGKPAFAPVTSSGNYNDLSDKPTLSLSNFSGKPTTISGYGISNAMTSNHPAASLTSAQIVNWNAAYAWGNSANAGYALATDYYTTSNLKTSGQSQVHWNNVTNKPTDLSGYGITNAMSTSHPASGISSADKTNWNTAYSWGNSDLAGYLYASDMVQNAELETSGLSQVHWGNVTNIPASLSGYGITDAMNSSATANSITTGMVSKWNNAFYWGDHSLAGYMTSANNANYYTNNQLQTNGQSQVHWSNIISNPTTLAGYGITNAMSTARSANSITNTDISNWNNAYSWGNHASAGYGHGADYFSKTNLQTNGGALVNWNNLTNTPNQFSSAGFSDVSITAPSNNQLLRYNSGSGKWTNITPSYLTSESQTLLLSTNQLTISPGNTVTFSNWDTDGTNDLVLSGTQSVSGNKTFSGILSASSALVAQNGINAGGIGVTNVGTPASAQDMANKLYVDLLWDRLQKLEKIYNTQQAGGTVTDYDGNVYNTVKIGTQTWMSENLKTLHFENGDLIPTTNVDITAETTPLYWFSPNNDAANIPVYGRLYTYFVGTDSRNVCPVGWHVPSKSEWETLIANYPDGLNSVGGIFKEVGTEHYIDPNVGANNQSGMTLLPNGNRHPDGFFAEFKEWGCFQTTTESDPTHNWHFHLFNSGEWAAFTNGLTYDFTKGMAYAIRCIKN